MKLKVRFLIFWHSLNINLMKLNPDSVGRPIL
jgi:hypothetical protein